MDLIVDILLCLAYLVEMKQEADIHASPPWMFKWRSYDLWYSLIKLILNNNSQICLQGLLYTIKHLEPVFFFNA
jgi:hypothetical protein